MPSLKTRSETNNRFCGQPCLLSGMQLPTCQDVMKLYAYYRSDNNLNTHQEHAKKVADDVMKLYNKASIPTIQLSSITQKVIRLFNRMVKVSKYGKGIRTSIVFEEKLTVLDSLFDICSCKCVDIGVRERSNCKCPFSMKIPASEWEFWIDQKTSRKMFIAGIDKVNTTKLLRKAKRQHHSSQIGHGMEDANEFEDVQQDVPDQDTSDEDVELDTLNVSDNEIKSCQNRTKYPELSKALDRCKVSNRKASLIVNAVLKDLNLLTELTALDQNKIQRERIYWRTQENIRHAVNCKEITCLGFDGKTDKTFTMKIGKRIIRKEEHYMLVAFPGGNYIDHVTPKTNRAVDVAIEIMSVIRETGSDKTLKSILCDGTNVNTGKSNGIITKLEQQLGRPLQWLVCLLHMNELPFRKYFNVVDEALTTGPTTSTGIISKELDFKPTDIPIATFQPIHGKVIDISEEICRDFSDDQLYFLRACLAVQTGRFDSSHIEFLQHGNPGNMNHARWLTKANRILRLYMSKWIASEKLVKIVSFIVNIYGPMWFQVKSHSTCQDGAKNFFFLVKLCQHLSDEDKSIVYPVLQNNNYFAHPENILLAAVGDDDIDIRKVAAQRIIAARHEQKDGPPRTFDKKNVVINFRANSYIHMIDWTKCRVTVPPLMVHISDQYLSCLEPVILPGIPCHSQSVERAVQDLSSTCFKVCGHEARHGMLLQCKRARMEKPVVNNKSNFL